MLFYQSLLSSVRLITTVIIFQFIFSPLSWADASKVAKQAVYTTSEGDTVSDTALQYKAEEQPLADPILAPDIPPSIAASSKLSALEDVQSAIYKRLRSARPELKFTDLVISPMAGVYMVKINGQLAFVSNDGRHMIAGEMYEVQQTGFVNLQEAEREQAEVAYRPQRAKMLQAVDKEDMVVYSPESEVKGHIYVFTDIDCGFCRKLHSQLPAMLAKGIEVRYLGFPRAGIKSKSAQKLVTTWCSDNPQQTMTAFKRGENLPLASCEGNPIADQYMLGQQLGVTGTPAIVLESGQLIPGAVSPEHLVREMGI
jgi:thiol:disulfide interchange protein DsbC